MKIHMHHAIVSSIRRVKIPQNIYYKRKSSQIWLFWYNMKICYIHVDFTVFLYVILLKWLYQV